VITTLLLALLTAAPAGAAPAGVEPPHAPVESALLRAAYPDIDLSSGALGHTEGVMLGRSSACVEKGLCILAVAASDGRDPGKAGGGGSAWTTFFAFRPSDGGWTEVASTAGPVISATGRWLVGVSVQVDADGPFITVTTSTTGGEEGDSAASHLWSWDGTKFLQVLTAASSRQAAAESEASFALCADRPEGHPSWELRSREREGKGKWTESKVRVAWGGQSWVEKPADRPCGERSAPVALAAAPAPAAAAIQVKAATASRTAPAPKGKPQSTAAANAIDGKPDTAWVPGGKKGGVGEWLQVELKARAELGAVQLLATCPGPDWKASPRLKRVRLRFEDGPVQEETLADVQSAQSIVVKRKAPARLVRIELLELYRGTKLQDACLGEVVLKGR
jgi:hypothetical protein